MQRAKIHKPFPSKAFAIAGYGHGALCANCRKSRIASISSFDPSMPRRHPKASFPKKLRHSPPPLSRISRSPFQAMGYFSL
jgi:hypothetical protein